MFLRKKQKAELLPVSKHLVSWVHTSLRYMSLVIKFWILHIPASHPCSGCHGRWHGCNWKGGVLLILVCLSWYYSCPVFGKFSLPHCSLNCVRGRDASSLWEMLLPWQVSIAIVMWPTMLGFHSQQLQPQCIPFPLLLPSMSIPMG